MRFSYFSVRSISGLAVVASLAVTAGCWESRAEPAGPSSSEPACTIPFPAEVPVPDGLKIESCTPSEKITGFHGKAPLPKDLDQSFGALKASYTAAGFTLYDNSSGKIRSVIFGGKDHRKGETQLNPKEGYLSVSINLYPADMEE